VRFTSNRTAPRTWPWPTRHGEDFRQFGHARNLAGAEIREFIVAVRRINRAWHRAVRRVASRRVAFPDTLRWRVVTARDKRHAAVTSSVRDAVSLMLRNGAGKGKDERSTVAHD